MPDESFDEHIMLHSLFDVLLSVCLACHELGRSPKECRKYIYLHEHLPRSHLHFTPQQVLNYKRSMHLSLIHI